MSPGRRSLAAALSLLLIASGVVIAGTVFIARRSQAQLEEELAMRTRAKLDEARRGVEEELNTVVDHIEFAGALLSGARPDEQQRELTTLVRAGREYRAARLHEASGRALIADPTGALSPEVNEAMAALAARIKDDRDRHVLVSPPVNRDRAGWTKVFGVALANGGVLTVLVDLQPIFGRLRVLESGAETRVLVVNAHGQAKQASSATVVSALSRNDAPTMSGIVDALGRGEAGSRLLDNKEARALGLPDEQAAAAYVPVVVKGTPRWGLALLESLSSIRSAERGVALRLLTAGGAALLCILCFGAFLVKTTRRETALRERLRHVDALAQVHDMTRRVLENIPAEVIVLTAAGTIASMNRAARERRGGDLAGEQWSAAFHEAGEAVLDRVLTLLKRAQASGRVASLVAERLPLYGADGRFTIHAVPIERASDAVAVLVIDDLSRVELLERQLLRTEKLATVGVLAAGVAHEVGTPLSVVRGRAEYVGSKLGEAHPQLSSMKTICEQIDRVSRTIRQLLDFARVHPSGIEPVDAHAVAAKTLSLMAGIAGAKQVTLRLEGDAVALPRVKADADQLQQVLLNLVVNAVDACARGGTVTVSLSLSLGATADASERLMIAVRDDGHGIEKDKLNQVFDPFFTTKKRGQGTGLGLTICAQIVRDHGGEIELESQRGRGTVVRVAWPIHSSQRERHELAS